MPSAAMRRGDDLVRLLLREEEVGRIGRDLPAGPDTSHRREGAAFVEQERGRHVVAGHQEPRARVGGRHLGDVGRARDTNGLPHIVERERAGRDRVRV